MPGRRSLADMPMSLWAITQPLEAADSIAPADLVQRSPEARGILQAPIAPRSVAVREIMRGMRVRQSRVAMKTPRAAITRSSAAALEIKPATALRRLQEASAITAAALR